MKPEINKVPTVSLSLYDKEHTAREKYIYFITGIATALFAYIGKGFQPQHPFTPHDSLVSISLFLFVGAFVFGAARILFYIAGLSKNREVVLIMEESGNFVDALIYQLENKDMGVPISINKKSGEPYTPEEMQQHIQQLRRDREKHHERMDQLHTWSTICYVFCHIFLIVGFILVAVSKCIL